jgi:hypothetical protein
MWHSLLSYHPRIGYTYTPSVKSRVPFETGGYLVKTNAAGFRSDHEFVNEPAPGKFRAILFGDSQTAGDGVSNGDRYSDRLQKLLPQLEVYNYGLAGAGTDQQYLTYLEFGQVPHDLLIIGLHVENIRRVNAQYLNFHDANGNEVFYAKPFYTIKENNLVLQNIPVPKQPWTKETLPSHQEKRVDWGGRMFPRTQAVLRRFVPIQYVRQFAKALGLRDLMQKVTKLNRVPDYDSPDNPGWILLRKIVETWIRGSTTPVLLLPIPMWAHFDGSSDPSGYQARFRELADDTGCYFHDPLPDLAAHSPEEMRQFRFKRDVHLSPKGHEAMAQSLAPVIERIMKRDAKHEITSSPSTPDPARNDAPIV